MQTVKAWAELIGYGKDYVSGVETGNSWPSSQFVAAYERHCELPDGSLLALHHRLGSTREDRSLSIPASVPTSGRPRGHGGRRVAFVLLAAVVASTAALVMKAIAGSEARTATAHIDTPDEGARVCYKSVLTGSAAHLPEGQDLWVIVRPLLTGILYPQPGPATVTAAGDRRTWRGTAYLGEAEKGYDERFEIMVVGAGSEASRTLKATHQTHSGLADLLPGTRKLHSISVTRDRC